MEDGYGPPRTMVDALMGAAKRFRGTDPVTGESDYWGRGGLGEMSGGIAEMVLSLLPGSGEVISARDSLDAGGRGWENLKKGNLGAAGSDYLDAATAGLGALPLVGLAARGARSGASKIGGLLKDASKLPTDEAARMARADEMGFHRGMPAEFSIVPSDEALRLGGVVEVDGQRFRGTTHAEASETAAKHLDRSLDAVFDDPAFRDGFETTAGRFIDREEALGLSRRMGQGGDIQPRLGLTSHGLTAPKSDVAAFPVSVAASAPGSPGGLGVWGILPPRSSDVSPKIAVPFPRNSDVRALVHRTSKPGVIDATGATNHEIGQTLENSWKEGYDAVVVKNHPTPGRDMLVVKDRAQLRAPEAGFDPKKRDLSDIYASLLATAGLGGMAGSGAAAAGSEQ